MYYSSGYKHLDRMFEIKRQLSKIPFYRFLARKKLKDEYLALEIYGFNLGMQTAFKELEEIGMVRRINK